MKFLCPSIKFALRVAFDFVWLQHNRSGTRSLTTTTTTPNYICNNAFLVNRQSVLAIESIQAASKAALKPFYRSSDYAVSIYLISLSRSLGGYSGGEVSGAVSSRGHVISLHPEMHMHPSFRCELELQEWKDDTTKLLCLWFYSVHFISYHLITSMSLLFWIIATECIHLLYATSGYFFRLPLN